jgi:hypothetical protein
MIQRVQCHVEHVTISGLFEVKADPIKSQSLGWVLRVSFTVGPAYQLWPVGSTQFELGLLGLL